LNLPLKYHGGKSYLAKRIVALMPPHTHYIEPYFGGGAVLFEKNPDGVSEVVNDLNLGLTEFWTVLQDPVLFFEFQRKVEAIPFSEVEWRRSEVVCVKLVDRAVAFFVRCRQSLAGRMGDFAPLSRNRVRRGMNEQASAWLTAVDGLSMVHGRLRRVVVLNRLAVEIIQQQDGEKTLFYLDPPYLPKTRTSPKVYEFEMTVANHEELLGIIRQCVGKVMLSGYDSYLYRRRLSNWTRHEFKLPNAAAGGTTKRVMTEVLWCNW
jgi:DNA adenine methylase